MEMLAVTRQDGNLHELSHSRRPRWRTVAVLPLKTNCENSGGARRRREETYILPTSGSFHSGIHLGWEMHAPPKRILSWIKYGYKQDGWPETTWKRSLSPLRLWIARQSSSPGFPYPYCSPPGCPFLIKSLSWQHMYLFGQFISVLDKSPFVGPGRGSPSSSVLWLIPLDEWLSYLRLHTRRKISNEKEILPFTFSETRSLFFLPLKWWSEEANLNLSSQSWWMITAIFTFSLSWSSFLLSFRPSFLSPPSPTILLYIC